MRRIRKFLSTTIIGGLVVILPLAVLFFFVRFLYNFLVNNLRPISQWFDVAWIKEPWLIDLLTVAILLVFCFLVGIVVRTRLGASLYKFIDEQLFSKLPFYKSIKETVQQFTKNKDYESFQVVVADAFNNGGVVTGFVTDISSDRSITTIFVPTGPNPTNGFIFHLPSERITPIDVTGEEAMKSIISVGAGSRKLTDQYINKKKE